MTTDELLDYLGERGVVVSAEGDRLKLSAPKGVLTADLRDKLTAAKSEILVSLRSRAEGDASATIVRAASRDAFPLSFAQERVWSIARRSSENQTLSLTYVVEGHLDVGALEKSLAAIAQRHEILRTTYEDALQHVHADVPVDFAVDDLRELPPEARSARAAAIETATGGAPFDLRHGPVMRVRLVLESEREARLVLACHAIVFDAGGIEVFAGELATHYVAFASGRVPELAPLAIQYGDYAAWQRRTVSGVALARFRDFWRARYSDLPAVPHLPGERVETSTGVAVETITLGPATLAAVTRIAQAARATPFMVFYATFAAFLHVRADVDEASVFTSIAGRSDPALAPLIGLFANWLLLRTELVADPTFDELVKRVREAALAAFAHPDLPFDKAIELRSGPGSIFGVLLVYKDHENASLRAGDVAFRAVPSIPKETPFAWHVSVERSGNDSATIAIAFDTGRYEASAIRGSLEDLARILELAADNPRLSNLRSRMGAMTKKVDTAAAPRTVLAPRDDLEKALVEIWERVLGAHPIGVDENFFALGGYSLLAVRLFDELERVYGVELTLPQFLRVATVERLAALVKERGK